MDVTELVKLVSDYGAMVVVFSIAIWATVFVVLRLFGKHGLVPWAVDKMFGDKGFLERIVVEHTGFVQSVKHVNEKIVEGQEAAVEQIRLLADKTEEIRTANLSEALATSTLQKHFKDSHDFNIAVVETGVSMAEKAAEKAGLKDDLEEYIEKIRYMIAAKNVTRHDTR